MSHMPCFQAPVGIPLHGHALNFSAKSSVPASRGTCRSRPSRRLRMVSVTASQPSAYSEKHSTGQGVPSPGNAIPSCSSDTPAQFVSELTTPSALEDVFNTLNNESAGEAPKLVLVEAYSKSCRACIGVRRIFERIAEEKQDVVRCLRFNAFDCGNLAQKLGVRGLPTFIVYKRSAQPSDEGYEWRRVDHFTTSKRSIIEQNIIDNL